MSIDATPAPRPVLSARLRLRLRNTEALLVIGAIGVVTIAALTLFGEQLVGFTADAQDLRARLLPPGTEGHVLGTDRLGRDVLARSLGGFRWSLPVGLLATLIAATLGTVIGVTAAWAGGWVRTALNRFIELAISFPYFVLAVAIIAVVGRGFLTLAIVLGAVSWMSYARVMYAETLKLMSLEYVLAARLMGISSLRIIVTYILRGLRARLIVMSAFVFADLLVAEAAISFLGIGAPVGAPSWGNLLSSARETLFIAPWLLVGPAGAVILVVLTANILGDGLNNRWNVGVHQE